MMLEVQETTDYVIPMMTDTVSDAESIDSPPDSIPSARTLRRNVERKCKNLSSVLEKISTLATVDQAKVMRKSFETIEKDVLETLNGW